MSINLIKEKLKELEKDLLEAHGFVFLDPLTLIRVLPYIDHFIEFQPGHGNRFTLNLCWKITADKIKTEGIYTHTIGGDTWFSHTKDAIGKSFEQIKYYLINHGLPFLNSISDLTQMIEKYEKASKGNSLETDLASPVFFFGLDEGWRHYNLGFSYKVIGKPEKAKEHFFSVINKFSNFPFDWIKDRKQRCIEELANIESETL